MDLSDTYKEIDMLEKLRNISSETDDQMHQIIKDNQNQSDLIYARDEEIVAENNLSDN